MSAEGIAKCFMQTLMEEILQLLLKGIIENFGRFENFAMVELVSMERVVETMFSQFSLRADRSQAWDSWLFANQGLKDSRNWLTKSFVNSKT